MQNAAHMWRDVSHLSADMWFFLVDLLLELLIGVKILWSIYHIASTLKIS